MYLEDSVDVIRDNDPERVMDTLPAYVFYRKTVAEFQDRMGFILSSEITIITEPSELHEPGTYYYWQGKHLYARAAPEIAMQHGEPHHNTITAEEVGPNHIP